MGGSRGSRVAVSAGFRLVRPEFGLKIHRVCVILGIVLNGGRRGAPAGDCFGELLFAVNMASCLNVAAEVRAVVE